MKTKQIFLELDDLYKLLLNKIILKEDWTKTASYIEYIEDDELTQKKKTKYNKEIDTIIEELKKSKYRLNTL